MVRITSAEFQKNIGRYQDLALTQPVTVTRNGRDRTVILSAEEYARLKRRDRHVLSTADFTQTEIDAIARSQAPAESAAFDCETE